VKNPVTVEWLKLKIVSTTFLADTLTVDVVIANNNAVSTPATFTIPLNTEKAKAIASFRDLLESQILEYLDARPRSQTNI
jgi:ribosomal protein S2